MDAVRGPGRGVRLVTIDPGARGVALIESLVAVVVLGLAAAALIGLLMSVSGGARAAAVEGRRAELAQRAADLVRAGRAPAATGTIRATVGGELYEAVYARRDDIAPGALEVTVDRPGGGRTLVLNAASPALVPVQP